MKNKKYIPWLPDMTQEDKIWMNQAVYEWKLPGINSSEAPKNAAYDSKTNVEWQAAYSDKDKRNGVIVHAHNG